VAVYPAPLSWDNAGLTRFPLTCPENVINLFHDALGPLNSAATIDSARGLERLSLSLDLNTLGKLGACARRGFPGVQCHLIEKK